MAICEQCGTEVAPIDKVVRGTLSDLHYFCSPGHATAWEEAQKAARRAGTEAERPLEVPVSPDSALADREIAHHGVRDAQKARKTAKAWPPGCILSAIRPASGTVPTAGR